MKDVTTLWRNFISFFKKNHSGEQFFAFHRVSSNFLLLEKCDWISLHLLSNFSIGEKELNLHWRNANSLHWSPVKSLRGTHPMTLRLGMEIHVHFSLKFKEFLVILNGKGNMSMISLCSDVKTLKYLIYYIYFWTFPTDGPKTISFVDVRQTESTLVQGTCGQMQSTGDNILQYEGIHQEFVRFLAHFICAPSVCCPSKHFSSFP